MRWRRATEVLWRTAPGYLVLAGVDGRIVEVDGPGGDIWSRLCSWVTEEELIADLARRYGADERIVAADVQSLLHELHGRSYVERDC
jgi:hypothetical protein